MTEPQTRGCLLRPTLRIATALLLGAGGFGAGAFAPALAADTPAPGHAPGRIHSAGALVGLATAAGRPSSALPTRSPSQLQTLFAKGSITGADVVVELDAIRKLLGGQRNAAAVGAVMGSGKDEPAGGGGVDLKAELLRATVKAGEEAIKPYISSINFGAIDIHLKDLTEDPKLLLEESLKLPSSKDMTPAQMQRVVNMAAIVLATRATGKMLKRAQADFAQVEQDYTRLIERREGAAKVLFEVLSRSAGTDAPPELAGTFGGEDMKFLRQNAQQMSLAQFSNDLGAQNLALRLLSKSDPAAFGEYKARSDGLLKSTRGYIRSAAGVTAFAALLANFGNETLAAARDKRGAEIFAAFPFAWEFVKEVPPLLKASWAVGAAGIVELPSKASKRFRLIEGDKAATEDLSRSDELFAAMKKRNVDALFAQSLFRTGFDGLLYKLYRCDPSEVGRMLDTAVPLDAREKFAAGHLAIEGARFSFANALKQPGPSKKEAELGDDLLRQEHRERSSVPAMGEVQRLATQGYGRWNNDQMLRMILANREGAASHATLQLDEVRIRPVPSMQSVFAYEALVDECSKQFGPEVAPAAAAAPGRKP